MLRVSGVQATRPGWAALELTSDDPRILLDGARTDVPGRIDVPEEHLLTAVADVPEHAGRLSVVRDLVPPRQCCLVQLQVAGGRLHAGLRLIGAGVDCDWGPLGDDPAVQARHVATAHMAGHIAGRGWEVRGVLEEGGEYLLFCDRDGVTISLMAGDFVTLEERLEHAGRLADLLASCPHITHDGTDPSALCVRVVDAHVQLRAHGQERLVAAEALEDVCAFAAERAWFEGPAFAALATTLPDRLGDAPVMAGEHHLWVGGDAPVHFGWWGYEACALPFEGLAAGWEPYAAGLRVRLETWSTRRDECLAHDPERWMWSEQELWDRHEEWPVLRAAMHAAARERAERQLRLQALVAPWL